jgi:plasmid maintenance system antidote protein VapI
MLESKQRRALVAESVTDDIPNRVAAAIRLVGRTQTAVAVEIGMTEPHLSDICRGAQKSVALETAHKLAEYFGCAIEDLFPSRAA